MADEARNRGTSKLGLAALWSVFAVLVLAGGWLVLLACGTYPILGWARNFCPLPAHRDAYLGEVAEGERLTRQVHVAEVALAETPPCPASAAPVVVPPAPTPAPPGPAPTHTTESQQLDDRVRERGGKSGHLQFTLAWNTLDDLDINVDCPGGRIGSRAGQQGPGICGDGVKDVDANRDLRWNMSSTPVENISWSDDVPDGTYTIEIIEYRAQTNRGNVVPFTLRMRYGDQEKICRDFVTTLPPSRYRRANGQTVTGSYRTITWQSGSDLPDCNFEHLDSVNGPAK